MAFYPAFFVYFLTFLCIAARERVTLPDVDRQYITEMLRVENPDYTLVETGKLIYELENFYTVIRDNLFACGPPKKIDAVYHLHVINTRLYRTFCEATFGRFIDHIPFWSGHPTSDEHQTDCSDQLSLLEAHGINVTSPCLWRTPQAKCRTACLHHHKESQTAQDALVSASSHYRAIDSSVHDSL
ncbi:hypothetical protein I4U23_016413 [Adineta vaga]|nr:hypothetical protein I4U23_016413 [Adineta vaga]